MKLVILLTGIFSLFPAAAFSQAGSADVNIAKNNPDAAVTLATGPAQCCDLKAVPRTKRTQKEIQQYVYNKLHPDSKENPASNSAKEQ